MTLTEWLEKVMQMRPAQYQSAARHKPLLLLWAIGRVRRGRDNQFRFSEVARELGPVLQSPLGASRRTDVGMPFAHLRSDGLWEILGASKLKVRKDGKRPLTSELRRVDAIGRLPDEVYALLKRDASAADVASSLLLATFWGVRDHAAVRKALNLPK